MLVNFSGCKFMITLVLRLKLCDRNQIMILFCNGSLNAKISRFDTCFENYKQSLWFCVKSDKTGRRFKLSGKYCYLFFRINLCGPIEISVDIFVKNLLSKLTHCGWSQSLVFIIQVHILTKLFIIDNERCYLSRQYNRQFV